MLRPLLVVVVLAAVGCGSSGPDSRDDDDGTPVFTIPAGAEVTVNVGECLAGVSPVRVCPDWDVRSLVEASLSGEDFELGEQKVEAGAALIRVRAKGEGSTTLTVEYVDERGNPETVRLRLRAVRVSRTRVGVPCENAFLPVVHPVAAGSRFEFSLFATAGTPPLESELTTGDISLVESAPGFTLTEPVDGKGVAVAPSEPGTYTWTLTGGDTVRFEVFGPDSVDLTLTEERAVGSRPRAIVLGARVNGAGVCVHDPGARVRVSTTGDGCATVLSGVEIANPMPVRLASGTFKFELAGQGSCDVDARLESGHGVTQAFDGGTGDAGTPSGTPVSGEGVELTQPLPFGQGCPESVSDGDCEAPWYLDGDCYIDSDWRIEHRDPTAPDGGVAVGEGASVGVGLTTQLRLALELGTIPSPIPILLGPPKNLSYQQDPAWDWTVFPPRESAGLALEPRACVGDRMLLNVTPLAPGEHGLTFRAENLDDEAELDIDARKVDRVLYTVRPKEGGPSRTGPSVELFVRSEVAVAARYERDNGTVLHGSAPLRVQTDDASALSRVRDPDTVVTGSSPHTLTVSSPAGPGALTFRVRDASGITAVGGFGEASLPQGSVKCAEKPVPLGEGGVAILGKPPTRPRVTLSGDGLVVSPESFEDGLCLEGVVPGASTVRLDWGSAAVERVWTVLPLSP